MQYLESGKSTLIKWSLKYLLNLILNFSDADRIIIEVLTYISWIGDSDVLLFCKNEVTYSILW